MASLATIFRQVEREGARWGLVPVMRDNKVAVCEMVPELPTRGAGHVVAPQKTPRVICSLDENSPMDAFAAILRHRLQRHHHDFMKMVRARQERLQKEMRAEQDLRRRDMRAHWRAKFIRSRTLFTPGLMPVEPRW